MGADSVEPQRENILIEQYAPVSPAALLDLVLGRGVGEDKSRGWRDKFLAEPDWGRSLEMYLGIYGLSSHGLSYDRCQPLLSRDLAGLDSEIIRQLNAILHHPQFKQLEASWRGLYFLTGELQSAREQIESEEGKAQIRIEILNVTKSELVKDFEKSPEFDRSQIWRKVYEEEFGMAGGEPFGAMVADYEFGNDQDDIDLLGKMADVAAGSFCPFIAGAAPKLLEIDNFARLERPLNLSATFEQLSYMRWRSLRAREDTKFIGLVLPRVLMRLPYEDDGSRADGFRFREEVEAPDHRNYLWGNAAYAFGAVLIRAFGSSRWFADIRGVERDMEAGGVVTGLPVHSFATDRRGIAAKASVDVCVREAQEQELSRLGLVPLCHAWDTEYSVFYGNASLHKPNVYDNATATANARISAMLQYTLCASRFAHYLNVLARNKIGDVLSPEDMESYLNRWLSDYVSPDEKANPEIKARFPLLNGRVEVKGNPASPGSYRMVMHLLPHFQLDRLATSLRLFTSMARRNAI